MGKHRNLFKEHPASKALPKRLFKFRALRNLTQGQFAILAGLNDHSIIARAEDGASLRLSTLHKIIRVLDTVA